MNGIILINKDKDKTSRDMVNELNHIFGMKKIGHTGTLDPMATGVLVICLGKYTKLVDVLSSLTKEYIAEIKVGIKTDTLDTTGRILEKRNCVFTKEEVLKVFESLKGNFLQTIPIYSAKKINGKKLYEYARNNEEVTLPQKNVEIFSLELLNITNETITFKTKVSKGTYIRALIEEICHRLNIIGAMSSLCRTKQGKFSLENSYTINEVKQGSYKLLTAKEVLNYPVYNLKKEEYQKVINGNKIKIESNNQYIILISDNIEIAIYQKEDDIYRPYVMLI